MKVVDRSPEDSQSCVLSLVVALFGRFSANQGFVNRVEGCLRAVIDRDDDDVELIVAFCDPRWKQLPALQTLPAHFKHVRVCEFPHAGLPANLFDEGRKLVTGHRVIFLSPQHPLDIRRLRPLIEASRADIRNSQSHAIFDVGNAARLGLPSDVPKSQLHGWILNSPILSISDLAISTVALDEIGGFDPSPILQQAACWDAVIRLTANHDLNLIKIEGTPPYERQPGFIPQPCPVSEDMRRRYMASGLFASNAVEREGNFLKDIPAADIDYLSRHIPSLSRADSVRNTDRPLRVTITGGPWEYHHNWLCFYTYFKYLEGTGFGTFKPLFDHLITREDIEGSDLVILSRCKVEKVRQILDWCKEIRVPSIYMIDDNWLTVAEDWPNPYKSILGPDTPLYKNFIFGIRHSDYVLTYNRLLADDVTPYAKNIVTLPNSVDLNLFEKTERYPSKRFVIGYSGSDRYDDEPFRAIAHIARTHDDVDLLIFGNLTSEQRLILSGVRVMEYGGVSYLKYAQMIREASPDILLAPLDQSRTSRSKCPNKYLEITAAGAVGVYSNLEPYSWHIENGVNGILVSDPRDWVTPILKILDKAKLQRMHASARADIIKNFEASRVAIKFADLMRSIADGRL